METLVYTIAIGLAMMASFATGMYVCTQIGEWIKRKTKKK